MKLKTMSLSGKGKLRDTNKIDGRVSLKLATIYPFWRDYDIISTDFKTYMIFYHCEL